MRTHPLKMSLFVSLFYIWIPVASYIVILVVAASNPSLYVAVASGEDGVVELLHIALGLVGFLLALRLLYWFWTQKNKLGIAFAVFSALVCLYIALEEASYGQHMFGWEADGLFLEVNKQQETNLHNISSWFNEKPRVLLELAIILGGLLLPLFPNLFMRFVPAGLRAYAPTTLFLPTSILVVVSRLPERLDLDGLKPIIGSIRHSEVQELYMFLFISLYIYFVLCLERHKHASA